MESNRSYVSIASLRVVAGRFFDKEENDIGAPVCVLGQAAASNLFGGQEAVGQYVKVNTQWLHVLGVVGPQLTAQTEMPGLPTQDLNNLIYMPLFTPIFRLADANSYQKDEIDGVYLQVASSDQSPDTAEVVRGLLGTSHRGADDFSVIVPAELLGATKTHAAHFRNCNGSHRFDFIAGRRHRNHEHHAGQYFRAHA